MILGNEQKTKIAQVIHRLVMGHPGHRVGYTKVLKLLYILDRECLRKFGYTATSDDYGALKNGPVLKDTIAYIKGHVISDNAFSQFIGKDAKRYIVPVVDTCPYDLLSSAELNMIDAVITKYARRSTAEMIELTHTFREWKETGGSSKTITLEAMAAGSISDKRTAAARARQGLKDRTLGRVLN